MRPNSDNTRRLLIHIGSNEIIRFYMELEKAARSDDKETREKLARKFEHFRELLAIEDEKIDELRKKNAIAASRKELIFTMTEIMAAGHESIDDAIWATWTENKERLLEILLDNPRKDGIVTIRVSGAGKVRRQKKDSYDPIQFPPYPVFVCFKIQFGNIVGHIKAIPEVTRPVALETGEPL